MPTTNPVPSTDPTDLLFNAGKLDEVVNGTANSFTDRLGVARRTVAGMNADFDAQLADAESDLNVYRADAAASAAEALGYLQTIRATSYGAYAEDPTTDPLGNPPTVGDEYFNTTANLLKRWNGTTWQASDINTANLAASSGSSLVGYDGGTVQDVLDGAKSLQDYAALRAYTGRAKRVYITGLLVTVKPAGIAGVFQYDQTDTTSADNGGTIIVGADGRRWKRDFSGNLITRWFGVIGSEIADDTIRLQAAINYARESKSQLEGVAGDKYRITSKLRTQSTGTYAPVYFDLAGAEIVVDFDSDDGFLIEGGSNRQTIKNLKIRPSATYIQSGSYLSTAVGARVLNARVDINGIASNFKGEGFIIESTGPNSNTSNYDLYASQCGSGILITGSADDLSVCQSRFRAFGNLKEGIRVADTAAMRQWTGFWFAEGNWTSDPNNTANFGVYIGKATGCDLWIYCEQAGGAASEIYASPTNTPYTKITSARQNKDVITGTAVSVQGKDLTQVDYNVSSGAGRASTPARFVGKMARTSTAGEYVRVPFVGASDVVNGYVRGELLGIHLDAPGGNNSVSVNDSYASLGGPSSLAVRRVFSGSQSLSTATPSATITLAAITASRSCAGRMMISGRSGGGAGQRVQIVDFSIVGTTLALATPSIDVSPATPPTIALSITGGNLQLALSYSSGTWGSTYNFSYSVDMTWA